MKKTSDIEDWNKYWTLRRRETPIGWFNRLSYFTLLKKVLSQLQITKDAKILDIGCGSGETLLIFRKMGYYNSIGIDYSPMSLKSCERLDFKVGKDVFFDNAEHSSFSDNNFDIIFSEGILEHYKDFTPLAKEMSRITSKYVILIQPNHFSPYGRILKLLWFISQKLYGGVEEESIYLKTFKTIFEKYGLYLKNYSPILQNHWVLCFTKSDPKSKNWQFAQKLEQKYAKNVEEKVWTIPYSLQYWSDFLYLNNVKGQGVEICCGNHGIYNFSENIIGLDSINFHKHNFIKGVGEHLPIKPVDFIVCCNGIDHCDNPKTVLNEMLLSSKKVVLWIYVYPRLVSWFMQKTDKMHPYHLTKKSLNTLLKNFSLKITVKEVYTTLHHLKYTTDTKTKIKLLLAYFLGIRALCLHLEVK